MLYQIQEMYCVYFPSAVLYTIHKGHYTYKVMYCAVFRYCIYWNMYCPVSEIITIPWKIYVHQRILRDIRRKGNKSRYSIIMNQKRDFRRNQTNGQRVGGDPFHLTRVFHYSPLIQRRHIAFLCNNLWSEDSDGAWCLPISNEQCSPLHPPLPPHVPLHLNLTRHFLPGLVWK